VLGFAEGSVEVRGASGARSLERVPSTAVVRLVAGPRGTVVAGYEDGTIGIWELESGKRLRRAKLHGPLQHLFVDGTRLHAITELGQRLSWDLSVLTAPRCEVLEQLWREVPVTWIRGAPEVRGRPAAHACP
jgi:hypothetical protein